MVSCFIYFFNYWLFREITLSNYWLISLIASFTCSPLLCCHWPCLRNIIHWISDHILYVPSIKENKMKVIWIPLIRATFAVIIVLSKCTSLILSRDLHIFEIIQLYIRNLALARLRQWDLPHGVIGRSPLFLIWTDFFLLDIIEAIWGNRLFFFF